MMPNRPKLRVLDLFSGLGGWSQAFQDRGHDVRTLDNNPSYKPTYCMDIRHFAKDPKDILGTWRPHIIVASPECTGWSTLGKAWQRLGSRREPIRVPRTPRAHEAVELVEATLHIIQTLEPWAWWMENPVGGLRKHPLTRYLRRCTIDYCTYGQSYRKPTDLFGKFAPAWMPRTRCQHDQHDAQVTDLPDSASRSIIPHQLSMDVAIACEAGPDAASPHAPIRLGEPVA